MSNVTLTRDAADAAAIDAIEEHHAELAGALRGRVQSLVDAVSDGNDRLAATARRELAAWCRRELVPHAEAEEAALYPPGQATTEARLLVTAMVDEHRDLVGLVGALGEDDDPVAAVGTARALEVLFAAHVRKENEQLLPLLARQPGVSIESLLDGMHDALGGAPGHNEEAHGHPESTGGHACGCHDQG